MHGPTVTPVSANPGLANPGLANPGLARLFQTEPWPLAPFDFHLLVPGAWTVRKAHDLTGKVEEAVCEALPGIEATVHIEPIEDRASWEDSALLPLEQQQNMGK